jgi:hypothetical protein
LTFVDIGGTKLNQATQGNRTGELGNYAPENKLVQGKIKIIENFS